MSAFVLSSKRHTLGLGLLVLTPPILPRSTAEWLGLEKTRPERIAPSAAACVAILLKRGLVLHLSARDLVTDNDADEGMHNITQRAMNYQSGITGHWRTIKNFDFPVCESLFKEAGLKACLVDSLMVSSLNISVI